MSVTQGLSFSNLTPHRSKNFCECPLILNIINQCAFKSTRYAFSILLHAEAKKGLYCSECQVGFLCNDQIKHAFLLSVFLMTQSLVHQTSPPGRSQGGQRALRWEGVMMACIILIFVSNSFIATQVNKHDEAFWSEINI